MTYFSRIDVQRLCLYELDWSCCKVSLIIVIVWCLCWWCFREITIITTINHNWPPTRDVTITLRQRISLRDRGGKRGNNENLTLCVFLRPQSGLKSFVFWFRVILHLNATDLIVRWNEKLKIFSFRGSINTGNVTQKCQVLFSENKLSLSFFFDDEYILFEGSLIWFKYKWNNYILISSIWLCNTKPIFKVKFKYQFHETFSTWKRPEKRSFTFQGSFQLSVFQTEDIRQEVGGDSPSSGRLWCVLRFPP